ncbi:MAG TPA: hypothetical protein VL752_09780 [Acidisoma sp.]|uniref:hypothetical protein n=1 Tax=Acidisoma sp. TaxID=1872115 RepID=UPI002C390B8B|nr:hypothetical protein [Acidisoma sp.]HTI01220.1 hypothetical protein [Acidisoma sp.]
MSTLSESAAAARNHTLNSNEGIQQHRRPCFVDTMRPITPAETDAWRFYLNLHRDAWRPARAMFRAVCSQSASPGEALLAFVAASGLPSGAATTLEAILQALAKEG